MAAFLGGPAWPELDATLARGDFPGAIQLAERASGVDAAERQLIIGVCHSMFHRSDQAAAALVDSFRCFGADRPERAAIAAVFLGRLHYFVHDSPSVANGWFARARSLVADRSDCAEHALAALPLAGCFITDVSQLRDDATAALAVARQLGDRNLHAKALADLGTATVSLALVEDGMALLDEAMAMLLSGEVGSPFASVDVICNLLSSCGRVGDIRRADEWTHALEVHLGLDVEKGQAFLYAHCRSELGRILCDVGRWDEAEVALRLATARSAHGGAHSEGQVRATLAELWVAQGRLDDAERLLSGRGDHQEALFALAGLHLARGAYADASRVARQAAHVTAADRVRTSRLLAICVQAELARDNSIAAGSAAEELQTLAAGRALPVLHARAALARGRIAEHSRAHVDAVHAYEAGLQALTEADWPLLRAELHLALGRVLAATDAPAAIAEARAAHLTYERIGAPASATTAQLLNTLGVPTKAPERRTGPTAALSRREREVLDLLREGLSNAEIAGRQHNSVRTIEHHVSAVLRKLGLRSRAEAAVYAATLDLTAQTT